ncbi:MAG TPA: sigma-54 dependent transcriptional regulator, partial [Candidatus Sulfotelmatobacter sp.]|nr:sigma-54 dependent transcriptional regulator [Candidatus Sulfotelmatobacter sp.]
TKPFDIESLQEQVANVLEKRKLLKENISLRQLIGREYQFEKIVGKSAEIREVFKVIDDVAANNATVLITGESGTGKELVARAIHNRSPRRDKLFVAVNCAAIPENLLESELFGHEKGSFTGALDRQIGKFEIAGGGSLFLDEVGTLPLPMQAKLLRALQQREIERIGSSRPLPIDVRIISATNFDLRAAVKERRFREDLYYRLNVIPVVLPPLRARKEDIPVLAVHFLKKYNSEFGRKIKGFNKEVMTLLRAYDWPGNVRELENLVERLVVLTKGSQIGPEKLPSEIKGELAKAAESSGNRLDKAVRNFEADFIRQAIDKAGGRKGRAAKLLGIHRNTLRGLEKKLKM